MKDKISKDNVFYSVTVGIVGHCTIDNLQELKRLLETIPGFDLVFFKTSSGRLWIKEGEDDRQQ